ncbi:hypothetical protein HAZT_HAZT003025 [Hyalella azteca]|uniref:Dynein heavy chain C-terminal domain-containing protein n=1 Tax=Hyalella azteca TaxID=294128 RepID=A0A6A0H979_HYAAZ|nr:hypothetical protein HAZT_HAZT003025 [Hyalella azteca]
MRSSAASGRWLCLKNLHLVTAWLPVLEKELNALQPHQDFRLWLTAEPHPKFTAILLQSSLKITYEFFYKQNPRQAPAGLKKNLQRTMDSWSPEVLAKGNMVSRAQALFVLAWTHAVLQERRTYIPQGWSKFYEFSYADLKAGADIIDRLYTIAGMLCTYTIAGMLCTYIIAGMLCTYTIAGMLCTYTIAGMLCPYSIAGMLCPYSIAGMLCPYTIAGMLCTYTIAGMLCTYTIAGMLCTYTIAGMLCTYIIAGMLCTYTIAGMLCTYTIAGILCTYIIAEFTQFTCSPDGAEIKWDFVIGLFENAIYGGRVDNVWDLRVLQSYLTLFFSSEVIGGKKPPARHLAPNLALPTTVNYQDYYGLVGALPEDDEPDHFGLPANIERSRQRMNSSRVIHQLKAELVGKFDKEKWRAQLSPVLNLWKKLNQGSALLQLEAAPPSGSNVSPLTAFVQLEQYQALQVSLATVLIYALYVVHVENYMVQAVHRSLAALSKVIRGTLLLTSEVQKLADSLLKQETPGTWHELWEGPDDPLEYLRSLVRRAQGAVEWAARNDSGALLRDSLDLGDTLHPGTFLNALRQHTAREYSVAMDELVLVSSWSRGGVPDARVLLKWVGLQLEGATFDGSRLMQNTHDSASITAAPSCTVAWVPKDKKPNMYQDDLVAVPVYTSSLRESVVCSLDVPCSKPSHQWIQAGIALLLTN